MHSGNEVGFDYPAEPDFEQDDFWFEEDYPEESEAEAQARMTPEELAADLAYLEERR